MFCSKGEGCKNIRPILNYFIAECRKEDLIFYPSQAVNIASFTRERIYQHVSPERQSTWNLRMYRARQRTHAFVARDSNKQKSSDAVLLDLGNAYSTIPHALLEAAQKIILSLVNKHINSYFAECHSHWKAVQFGRHLKREILLVASFLSFCLSWE